ncbi:tetraacyldisaccharide 4'-kinase [Deltaproteobacteria bacterium TL4]
MKTSTLFGLKLTWKTALPYSLLFTLGLIYEAMVLLRLCLYQKGILSSYQSSVPVISVGNITVGGSGKTPIVDYLLAQLKKKQITSSVLSRGYKRQTRSTLQRIKMSEKVPVHPLSFGDEPYFLASAHPEVPVYVCSKRSWSARLAEKWDQPQLMIMDDGYQHVALHRDLNLLLIDAERGLGNRRLLPLGELREPEPHWNRADAIFITKCNLGFSSRVMYQLQKELKVTCPIFQFDYLPKVLSRLDKKETVVLSELKQKRVMLSSAIAQPQGFSLLLKHQGAEVLPPVIFEDHHVYTSETVQFLLRQYHHLKPDYWITTEKDATKLQFFKEIQEILWFVEMEVVPEAKWDDFFIDFLREHKLL